MLKIRNPCFRTADPSNQHTTRGQGIHQPPLQAKHIISVFQYFGLEPVDKQLNNLISLNTKSVCCGLKKTSIDELKTNQIFNSTPVQTKLLHIRTTANAQHYKSSILSGMVHDWEASGAVFYFDLDRRCPSEIDDVFFYFFVSHLFCSLVPKSCERARDKETELELYAARRQCACHPESFLIGPVVSQGGSIMSMSQFLRGTKTSLLFKGNRWFLMGFYVEARSVCFGLQHKDGDKSWGKRLLKNTRWFRINFSLIILFYFIFLNFACFYKPTCFFYCAIGSLVSSYSQAHLPRPPPVALPAGVPGAAPGQGPSQDLGPTGDPRPGWPNPIVPIAAILMTDASLHCARFFYNVDHECGL